MSFKIVETTLSADLAASGTVALSYPSNTDSGAYENTYGHKAVVPGFALLSAPADFTLTFGTSSITFTYGASKTTIPAGTKLSVQLDVGGNGDADPAPWPAAVDHSRLVDGQVVQINLGSPDVADVDAIVDAVTATATTGAVAKVAAIVTADVPRNVTLDTSSTMNTTQVVTVTGTDEYGNTVVENLAANGTTAVAGKKAFKTVTAVSLSAALTAGNMDVGFGDVLGLPIALNEIAQVVKESQDGAEPTAGTLVKADRAVATATTGDVRGTYDPNAAADGAKTFKLVVYLPDAPDLGVAQYAG